MLGEMLMERESLRESKQAFGYGEDLQSWLSEERWGCERVEEELGLREEIVVRERVRKRKRRRELREVEAMEPKGRESRFLVSKSWIYTSNSVKINVALSFSYCLAQCSNYTLFSVCVCVFHV